MSQELSRFRKPEEKEQSALEKKEAAREPREFPAVDDLLRHDSEQNPVPPAVARRVNESISREPKPARSWWRQLLGGGSP